MTAPKRQLLKDLSVAALGSEAVLAGTKAGVALGELELSA